MAAGVVCALDSARACVCDEAARTDERVEQTENAHGVSLENIGRIDAHDLLGGRERARQSLCAPASSRLPSPPCPTLPGFVGPLLSLARAILACANLRRTRTRFLRRKSNTRVRLAMHSNAFLGFFEYLPATKGTSSASL